MGERFVKSKMTKTLSKWKEKSELKYILVNEEAFAFYGATKLDERVFKVINLG